MSRILPEYSNPPINEVAIGVQFKKLDKLHFLNLGPIWNSFKDSFPNYEEHALLDPLIIEKFNKDAIVQKLPRIELIQGTSPLPRLFFINSDGDSIIQFQNNRFVRNWRKGNDEDQYPRYGHLIDFFIRDYELFCDTVKSELIGEIEPEICEISYFNIIPCNEIWNNHAQIHKVFKLVNPVVVDSPLELENANLKYQYFINDEEGNPYGMLRVNIIPAFSNKDGSSAFRFNLSFQGNLSDNSVEGLKKLIDLGHEIIVKTFTTLTTSEMHKYWERTL